MYQVTTSTKVFLCRSLSRRSPSYYLWDIAIAQAVLSWPVRPRGRCRSTCGQCRLIGRLYIAKDKTGEARQRIGKKRLPRRNRLRHHRLCIRTLAKWRRWSQGRNTVKHLSQLHAQRKIYLAAKSSCVCANSPSHGMDGGALAFRSPTKPSLLSTR